MDISSRCRQGLELKFSTSIDSYGLSENSTFLLKYLRSKLLSWQFSRSSPRGWTGRQRRAAWIKTPSKHGRRGALEKIKSYLQEGGVGQHLGDLLSIVAFIQEIQLQWNVLLCFLHQPRKCKVWEQPMNHLHQHLEVTWKPAFIQSVCSGVYNESDNDAHNIFPKSARTTSELMKKSWDEVVVPQLKTTSSSTGQQTQGTYLHCFSHNLSSLDLILCSMFCRSFSALTSITIMSLVLWRWTLGCWTLTATVLPSCNTALWTWAKEAAPWGLSSNATNSSDSCNIQTEGTRLEELDCTGHFHNKTFRWAPHVSCYWAVDVIIAQKRNSKKLFSHGYFRTFTRGTCCMFVDYTMLSFILIALHCGC